MPFDEALFALAALGVVGFSRRRIRAATHTCLGSIDPCRTDADAAADVRRAIEHAASGDAPRRALDDIHRRGLEWLPATSDGFPPQLAAIPDPPIGILVRGNAAALSAPAVAIVGSRRASPTGVHLASMLSSDLATEGLVIVSGLARGIDAAAHRGALESPGTTVAVLGGGHARLYPAQHAALARSITDNEGAIVSEYPPDWPSHKEQFPERNRLVSGLALGVVVVEASDRSGSLITARLALEQGREVMAVPGPVGAHTSKGCHRLIKQGAALIEDADDVLAALGLERRSRAAGSSVPPPDVSAAERRVLDKVQFETTTVDVIVAATELGIGAVLQHLAKLELAGFVEAVTGGYIRRPSQLS